MSELETSGGRSEGGASAPPPDPPPGNGLGLGWKKAEILGRPLSAFFTAVAVGLLGLFGQMWLKEREAAITERASFEQAQATERAAKRQAELTKRDAKQQDVRLYTDLMTRREQSDSALRTEMFKAILDEFLVDPSQARTSIPSRLLKLELLALNFGDALSLSPLFLAVDNEIERPAAASGALEAKQVIHRKRLRSLARRVSGAQLSALIPRGQEIKLQVPLSAVGPVGKDEAGSGGSDGRYTWPDDFAAAEGEENKGDESWSQEERKRQLATRTLDGVTRSYQIEFSDADAQRETVDVKLTIRNDDDPDDRQQVSFELNFFNFPMIDSTRLSRDQRFALVLERFDRDLEHIVATGVAFPGSNASLRDKPFINDIMERLQAREDEREPGSEEDL